MSEREMIKRHRSTRERERSERDSGARDRKGRETEEEVKQKSVRDRVTEEMDMPVNGLQRKVDYTIKN